MDQDVSRSASKLLMSILTRLHERLALSISARLSLNAEKEQISNV